MSIYFQYFYFLFLCDSTTSFEKNSATDLSKMINIKMHTCFEESISRINKKHYTIVYIRVFIK